MTRPFVRSPLWYKDAVIYEVHVRCFHDSDGSGMGDFRGLIGKLDYIRGLGVNAIWLLPFYPSPLRDDGYDIADYRDVHPAYGTLALFREFLEEAHARGMYVITELVINHTSDRHPWFERARRAPAGSPERDFYVWSATKDKYAKARIIFKDYEPSNWTWDPVAKANYWHRFYSHQPDLNFDNPAVHDAVLATLDYWLEMGVDGLRLDAVPYLYEREGTHCENLPETHAFLRKLSAHVRARYDDRMLLAEANQWPEDAVAYFGDGESCDMAFHFPLMTRLYMAVQTEDRFPIVDILDQTPPIPAACQWAIFLRNHDELTLEMVSDEERDYMYRVFAKDRRARLNLGIRRRLAPLLGNNRRKIELMNILLFSLPGTPVIYYGDEIGMGDNYYLGDRDGVRTPMQWNADRNAGFSSAPAQRLYLPVIAEAEHHYEAVNVQAQEANPSSLLWWMRRRIRLRQAHPVFGRGGIRFLDPDNGHVLAFIRESVDEAILVAANLSEHPQAARLDLSVFRGIEPVELAGEARFPTVDSGPYTLTLGGHEALWLSLRAPSREAVKPDRVLPDVGEASSLAELAVLPSAKLAFEAYLGRAPGFAGGRRLLDRMALRDPLFPFPYDSNHGLLTARAEPVQGDAEDYALWFAFHPDGASDAPPASALVARARIGSLPGHLCEATHMAGFRARLISETLRPGGGAEGFRVEAGPARESLQFPATAAPSLLESDAGEFRILVRHRLLFRGFRRLRVGDPSDFEVVTELKKRFPKARVPTPVARVENALPGSPAGGVLGYVQRFVPARRTARDLAIDGLRHFLAEAATSGSGSPPPRASLVPPRLDFQSLPRRTQDFLGGTWAEFVFLLGQRLAELHRLLARCGASNPDFAPEPLTLLHQHALYYSVRARARRAFRALERRSVSIVPESESLVRDILARQDAVLEHLRGLLRIRSDGLRIRAHGDPRLDRILFTGKDFVFTGFDGPPWSASSERAFRVSPLHDVAGVLWSLNRFAAEFTPVSDARPVEDPEVEAWTGNWAELSGGLFLDGYLGITGDDPLLPSQAEDREVLTGALLIERMAHEILTQSSPMAVLAALEGVWRASRNESAS